jgi:hypothetical protein
MGVVKIDPLGWRPLYTLTNLEKSERRRGKGLWVNPAAFSSCASANEIIVSLIVRMMVRSWGTSCSLHYSGPIGNAFTVPKLARDVGPMASVPVPRSASACEKRPGTFRLTTKCCEAQQTEARNLVGLLF